MPLLDITFDTLPAGACPATLQAMLALFSQHQFAILNNLDSNVVIAAADPGASNYGKIWFKTTAGTDYPGGTFFSWINGAWCSPHPLPPGSIGFLATGKLIADIPTYDGGTAGAITDHTGAMWEVVAQLAGRFPMSPDADGGTYPPGGTGGSATHMQTQDEMFPHAHRRNADGHTEDVHLPAGTPGAIAGDYSGGTLAIKQYSLTDVAGGDATHTQKAMSILPPYFGIPIIRRTNRIYRVA